MQPRKGSTVYRQLVELLETDGRTPGDWLDLDFGAPDDDGAPMYVANTSNDGFDLYIGYRNKWLFSCNAGDARRLAWWIIWDWWIVATWCGMRRRLYFWALRRHAEELDRRQTAVGGNTSKHEWPGWANDIIYHRIEIGLGWRDRLHILLTGKMRVEITTHAEVSPGRLQAVSRVRVQRAFRGRGPVYTEIAPNDPAPMTNKPST